MGGAETEAAGGTWLSLLPMHLILLSVKAIVAQ